MISPHRFSQALPVLTHRVVVFGGRNLSPYSVSDWLFHSAETVMCRQLYASRIIFEMVISGGAPGADTGAAWWATRCFYRQHVFMADWKKYGNRAGPIRNQKIIDEGKPTVGLAFPGGRGTRDMARRLETHNIPVIRISGEFTPPLRGV